MLPVGSGRMANTGESFSCGGALAPCPKASETQWFSGLLTGYYPQVYQERRLASSETFGAVWPPRPVGNSRPIRPDQARPAGDCRPLRFTTSAGWRQPAPFWLARTWLTGDKRPPPTSHLPRPAGGSRPPLEHVPSYLAGLGQPAGPSHPFGRLAPVPSSRTAIRTQDKANDERLSRQ